jgi:cobalamin-dependent methionine synthase I
MIIVGELINARRKAIKIAIETESDETIKKVAQDQSDAGANYIDVNAGVFESDRYDQGHCQGIGWSYRQPIG